MSELQKLVINLDETLGKLQPFIGHHDECSINDYDINPSSDFCDCNIQFFHNQVYNALTKLKAEVFKI